MKTNKNSSTFSLPGYILFLIPLTLSISLGIVIYELLSQKTESIGMIALFLLIYILISTFAYCTLDIIRRRIMIDKPVEQILDATQRIATGDFNVSLTPLHAYNRYDQYDEIMQNINKMAKELSQSEILKKDFISNVSHEIKTPLSLIQNYASALQDKKLDQETKEKYIQTIVSASKRLSLLISNILKLNKLENQAIRPNKEKLNIGELLRENVLQFESVIDKKNLILNCEIYDIDYITDSSYMEIIFNNLISNAIKFTPDNGTISITLKIQSDDIIFAVADTGCGINHAVGARIFEKFFQGDSSHANEGNGLGLALVKKIIDIMGGQILVESEENKGSTFTVKLKRNVYE